MVLWNHSQTFSGSWANCGFCGSLFEVDPCFETSCKISDWCWKDSWKPPESFEAVVASFIILWCCSSGNDDWNVDITWARPFPRETSISKRFPPSFTGWHSITFTMDNVIKRRLKSFDDRLLCNRAMKWRIFFRCHIKCMKLAWLQLVFPRLVDTVQCMCVFGMCVFGRCCLNCLPWPPNVSTLLV